MTKLYYDNSKDLYEGLIIEHDDAGVQCQVGQIFPAFGDKYGLLFVSAPTMYKALNNSVRYLRTLGHQHPDDDILWAVIKQGQKALALAKEK